MTTSSEKSVAYVNKNHFLQEFTYSMPLFLAQDRCEHEFADSVMWIDNLLVLIQIKERNLSAVIGDPANERSWYLRNVLKKRVTQLARTHDYLKSGQPLELRNDRGVKVRLDQGQAKDIYNLVVYAPSPLLSPQFINKKSYVSKRVGFVHLMEYAAYVNICTTLVTPFEIADYLIWRQTICLKKQNDCDAVSEKALVGQFLLGNDNADPSRHFEEYTDRLSRDIEEHNIYGILHKFLDRIQFGNTNKEYYFILKELAKLKRDMMRDFLDRYIWSMKECKKESPGLPRRMTIPAYDCSFIFIPLAAEESDRWHGFLESFTHLNKHEFRTRKAIGITIAPAPDSDMEHFVNWLYLDSEWKVDDETEKFLQENNPLRSTKMVKNPRYRFN